MRVIPVLLLSRQKRDPGGSAAPGQHQDSAPRHSGPITTDHQRVFPASGSAADARPPRRGRRGLQSRHHHSSRRPEARWRGRDPPRAPRYVRTATRRFHRCDGSPSRRRLMTCQPANSSPSFSSHPPTETAADARPPWWDQEISSPAHRDTRCPDANGGEGKSVAARRPETPFHQTTSHHEAPPRGPAQGGNAQ